MHSRGRRRRSAWLVISAFALVAMACTSSPKSQPIAPLAPTSSTPASALVTPSATTSATLSASAAAPTASALATTPCASPNIDLSVAAATSACAQMIRGAMPSRTESPPISVSLKALSTSVQAGKQLALEVTFQNDSDGVVTLYFAQPIFFGGALSEVLLEGPGHGSSSSDPATPPAPNGKENKKTSEVDPEVPRRQVTPGFGATATTPTGVSVETPRDSAMLLGLLGGGGDRTYTGISVAPHGHAIAHVLWRADGFDPKKDYWPKKRSKSPLEGLMMPNREPLPA
ncbi:MAG: hypothetical protein U0165_03350 [Polyangiaceae bacterium]